MAKKTTTYPKYYLNQRTHGVMKIEKASDLDKWAGYPIVEVNADGSSK